MSGYRQRRGLLVPTSLPDDADALDTRLHGERALADVRRHDDLARRTSTLDHRIALDDLAERKRAAARVRRERAQDVSDASELSRLYRKASRAGTRAMLRSQIEASAEIRALRVASVRRWTLRIGVPILGAFAAWSTAGVQLGVARTLGLSASSAGWWAAWAVEPALMTIVVLTIVVRAVLQSSGGHTDGRLTSVEWAALATSVALNLAGGGVSLSGSGVVAGVAHSVGPLGAALTAYLIGVIDGYVSAARPMEGAPTLASLGLAGVLTDPAQVPAQALSDGGTYGQVTPDSCHGNHSGNQGAARSGNVEIVQRAAAGNPEASISELATLTGLSRATVRKYLPPAPPETATPVAPVNGQRPSLVGADT
ncbi:MAG: hypothetical protein JXA67_16510 [Micromonosporaceae bacterium]|nr:hypothetical protein [Micromonosporaceae bacterium]